MSGAQPEPSMDEILASIRRIISEEDDGPAADENAMPKTTLTLDDAVEVESAVAADEAVDGATDEAGAEPEALLDAAEPEAGEPAPNPVDDFSDAETTSDDVAATAADDLIKHEEHSMPASDAAPQSQMVGAEMDAGDSQAAMAAVKARVATLVSDTAAASASTAFGALEQNVRVSQGSGRTIEDIIEQMLAPMLSEWLDTNLPRIVEEKVEDEVRRIARRR